MANVLLKDSISGQQMKTILDNLESSSVEISAITQSLTVFLNDIESGEGALNYITKDEALVKNIDSTMTNIKESTKKFNENMEALKHNFLLRGYFKKLERQEKKNEIKE